MREGQPVNAEQLAGLPQVLPSGAEHGVCAGVQTEYVGQQLAGWKPGMQGSQGGCGVVGLLDGLVAGAG